MFTLIPHIVLMLLGSTDANSTEFTIRAMRVSDLGVFCVGLQITSTSYFQATGQPMKADILPSLRQFILLMPLILLLPLHFGLSDIPYAGPIADITSAIIIFFFTHHEMKKLDVRIVWESGEELGIYGGPIARYRTTYISGKDAGCVFFNNLGGIQLFQVCIRTADSSK